MVVFRQAGPMGLNELNELSIKLDPFRQISWTDRFVHSLGHLAQSTGLSLAEIDLQIIGPSSGLGLPGTWSTIDDCWHGYGYQPCS